MSQNVSLPHFCRQLLSKVFISFFFLSPSILPFLLSCPVRKIGRYVRPSLRPSFRMWECAHGRRRERGREGGKGRGSKNGKEEPRAAKGTRICPPTPSLNWREGESTRLFSRSFFHLRSSWQINIYFLPEILFFSPSSFSSLRLSVPVCLSHTEKKIIMQPPPFSFLRGRITMKGKYASRDRGDPERRPREPRVKTYKGKILRRREITIVPSQQGSISRPGAAIL